MIDMLGWKLFAVEFPMLSPKQQINEITFLNNGNEIDTPTVSTERF